MEVFVLMFVSDLFPVEAAVLPVPVVVVAIHLRFLSQNSCVLSAKRTIYILLLSFNVIFDKIMIFVTFVLLRWTAKRPWVNTVMKNTIKNWCAWNVSWLMPTTNNFENISITNTRMSTKNARNVIKKHGQVSYIISASNHEPILAKFARPTLRVFGNIASTWERTRVPRPMSAVFVDAGRATCPSSYSLNTI